MIIIYDKCIMYMKSNFLHMKIGSYYINKFLMYGREKTWPRLF
jgi:hypothetical protein